MPLLDLQAMQPKRIREGRGEIVDVPSNVSLTICTGGTSNVSLTVCI